MTEVRTAFNITPASTGELATIDMDAAFADFLRLRVANGNRSDRTAEAYRQRVSYFVAWCDSNGISAGHATESDAELYRRHLVDAGYASVTIDGYLQSCRRFFDALSWRNMRHDNPFAGLKAPADATEAKDKVKYLPLDGLRRLLASPDSTTPMGKRDAAILMLMGKYGLRVIEIERLKISDLDMSDPAWIMATGKRMKRRQIFLDSKDVPTLDSWLASRLARDDHAHLFVALDRANYGKPLGRRNIRRMVDKYLDQCGLKNAGVSCHSLRHSAATWALYASGNERAVQDLLGHTKPETTQIYAQVVDRIKSNPVKELNALLGDHASDNA